MTTTTTTVVATGTKETAAVTVVKASSTTIVRTVPAWIPTIRPKARTTLSSGRYLRTSIVIDTLSSSRMMNPLVYSELYTERD